MADEDLDSSDDESTPSTMILERLLSYNHVKICKKEEPQLHGVSSRSRFHGISKKVKRKLDDLKISHSNAYDAVESIFCSRSHSMNNFLYQDGKDKIKKKFEIVKAKFLEKVND